MKACTPRCCWQKRPLRFTWVASPPTLFTQMRTQCELQHFLKYLRSIFSSPAALNIEAFPYQINILDTRLRHTHGFSPSSFACIVLRSDLSFSFSTLAFAVWKIVLPQFGSSPFAWPHVSALPRLCKRCWSSHSSTRKNGRLTDLFNNIFQFSLHLPFCPQ